jgi:uncharacterized RDD family membrane protein YckC
MQTDLGRRIGAALIDIVLLGLLFVLLAVTIGDTETEGANASFNLNGGPAILYAALVLAYYVACEAAVGQTLGKMLLKMRVVGEGGAKPSFGQILGRNLMRIVDGLPFLDLVGFITALATGEKGQRVGDIVAKTYVVKT